MREKANVLFVALKAGNVMNNEELISFLLHAYCTIEHADVYSARRPDILKHKTKQTFNTFLDEFKKQHGKHIDILFDVENNEDGNTFVNTQEDVDEAIKRIARAISKLPKATLPSLAEQIENVTIQI